MRKTAGDNIYCTRSETALRHERGPRILREIADKICGLNILRQIEVRLLEPRACVGNCLIQVVGRRADDRIARTDKLFEVRLRTDVQLKKTRFAQPLQIFPRADITEER